jgi:hypothetical protein
MCKAVTHTAHVTLGYGRMLCDKISILIHEFGYGFTDDDNIEYHSLLGSFISEEVLLALALHVIASQLRCILNML